MVVMKVDDIQGRKTSGSPIRAADAITNVYGCIPLAFIAATAVAPFRYFMSAVTASDCFGRH
jgi:hypothetical protein